MQTNLQAQGPAPIAGQMNTLISTANPNGDTLPYTANAQPVGTGSGWKMQPSLCGLTSATATVTNSFNIDWSQASVFAYQPTAGQTIWPLFANQTPGQQISLVITQPTGGLSYVVWPAGITFVGGTKTLSSVTAYVDFCVVNCVSQSVFIGNLGKNVS